MGPRGQEPHQGGCGRRGVGDAAEEDVLPRDAARGSLEVLAAGGHHLGHSEKAGGGHDGTPGDVVGGMERDGQVDRDTLVRQPADARHQPHRGDGHVPEAQARPLRGMCRPQKAQHLVVIVQRLAHAHHHQPRHPARRRLPGRGEVLRHDLPRRQGPDETRVAAGAETAGLTAPDLGTEAHAVAVSVGQEHRLHGLAVGQGPEQLDRPAVAALAFHQPGAVHHRHLGQLAPQAQGQVGHLVEPDDQALIHPGHDLPRPVGRLAQLTEETLPALGHLKIQQGRHANTSILTLMALLWLAFSTRRPTTSRRCGAGAR